MAGCSHFKRARTGTVELNTSSNQVLEEALIGNSASRRWDWLPSQKTGLQTCHQSFFKCLITVICFSTLVKRVSVLTSTDKPCSPPFFPLYWLTPTLFTHLKSGRTLSCYRLIVRLILLTSLSVVTHKMNNLTFPCLYH